MQLQFQKSVYNCLRLLAEDVKNEEQTQEVKLPEAMPDIGSVVGAWGQLLIRSKEWRDTGISISGGVMTWVLYAPEDGSEVRTVEGWIPFQMRWDFPQAQRDGKIIAACLLRSVDARCLSARKMMVRASISAMAQALEPSEFTVYAPGAVPEDVQLLHRRYPVRYPAEAGEKVFQLDEDFTLPAECMDADKLMRYELQPEITDRKLMADKVVFRGMAVLRALLRCGDGQLKSCAFEVPFSQYAQLDKEYDSNASVMVVPALTSLELERQEDGKLRLKAGLIGQYTVMEEPVLEVVEDAYSPQREVQLHIGQMEAPAVLDMHRELIGVQQTVASESQQPMDVTFSVQQPVQQRSPEGAQLGIPGCFQLLHSNEQGFLQGTSVKWEGRVQLPANGDTRVIASCAQTGSPRWEITAEGLQLHALVAVEAMTVAQRGISQVEGLELGELQEPDPGRPGLVLRRAGDADLWQLAKQAGSTVEAIRRANNLEDEPAPGRMLLIPIC